MVLNQYWTHKFHILIINIIFWFWLILIIENHLDMILMIKINIRINHWIIMQSNYLYCFASVLSTIYIHNIFLMHISIIFYIFKIICNMHHMSNLKWKHHVFVQGDVYMSNYRMLYIIISMLDHVGLEFMSYYHIYNIWKFHIRLYNFYRLRSNFQYMIFFLLSPGISLKISEVVPDHVNGLFW